MASYEGIAGRVDRIGRQPIASVIASKAPIRHVDMTLVFTAFLLTAFGNLMVYSASATRLRNDGLPERMLLNRQMLFSAIAVGVMVVIAAFSYRRLRAWGPVAYIG